MSAMSRRGRVVGNWLLVVSGTSVGTGGEGAGGGSRCEIEMMDPLNLP